MKIGPVRLASEKERNLDTDTHAGERHVKMKAEFGVMHLLGMSRIASKAPDQDRGMNGSPPEAQEGPALSAP